VRFARTFEYETQSLLDQVLELATLQCRLRLGPAIEIVREFDRGLGWLRKRKSYLLLLKFDFTLEINGSEEAGCSGMRDVSAARQRQAHAVEA
jgi:hypothetical protein